MRPDFSPKIRLFLSLFTQLLFMGFGINFLRGVRFMFYLRYMVPGHSLIWEQDKLGSFALCTEFGNRIGQSDIFYRHFLAEIGRISDQVQYLLFQNSLWFNSFKFDLSIWHYKDCSSYSRNIFSFSSLRNPIFCFMEAISRMAASLHSQIVFLFRNSTILWMQSTESINIWENMRYSSLRVGWFKIWQVLVIIVYWWTQKSISYLFELSVFWQEHARWLEDLGRDEQKLDIFDPMVWKIAVRLSTFLVAWKDMNHSEQQRQLYNSGQFIFNRGQVGYIQSGSTNIIIMVQVSRLIQQHLKVLMQPYLFPERNGRYPTLDRHISVYFKQHKSLGSNERRVIYDKAYDLIRYHHYLNHLCKGSTDLEYRLDLLHSSDFYTEMDNQKLAKWIRCSYPKQLYQRIEQSMGSVAETFDLCKAMNTRAPLTIRINPAKTTRTQFLKKISKFLNIQLEKTEISPFGVKLPANRNIDLYDTDQFKDGHFQVQDEASQIAALQVKCQPGNLVLDYCSGSGGKSLAIAHLLEGKGQIFLHDPRLKALQNAKKRFNRAGITNVQYHSDDINLQKKLHQKADWVILDVPCSGVGTLRRNPDIKLRFNEQSLKYNILQQQQIFTKALPYLKRGGKIAYMTCSLLAEENQAQIRRFIKQFGLEVVQNQVLKTKTSKGGMDSMFAVVLKRSRG